MDVTITLPDPPLNMRWVQLENFDIMVPVPMDWEKGRNSISTREAQRLSRDKRTFRAEGLIVPLTDQKNRSVLVPYILAMGYMRACNKNMVPIATNFDSNMLFLLRQEMTIWSRRQ